MQSVYIPGYFIFQNNVVNMLNYKYYPEGRNSFNYTNYIKEKY